VTILAATSLPLAVNLWTPEGGWIVLTAAATNSACAIVGCFLVLRRMSLMGDALSHSVLPGLAFAFILSGSFSIGPLMLGAAVAGLLSTFLIQTLHQYARVPSDASMGVVFTSLFALGVVMIQKGIHGVHFDVSCVYEGALELAPLYTQSVLGMELPEALVSTGCVLALNAVAVTLFWKEFKLSSFDPALATTMGYSAGLMHYALMALVAMTAVASFEAVGAILVVGMLIMPAATAHLLVDRLGPMVLVAVAVGVLAAVLGYVLGAWIDTNYAGIMTVAAAGLYGLAVLFSPRYGLVSTVVRNVQTSLRVIREDMLAMLYRIEELRSARRLGAVEARRAVGGGLIARWGLSGLIRGGRVAAAGEQLELTDRGRNEARQMVRTHRLWETYLVQYLGLPLDHVHEPAHRVEHFIGPEMRDELREKVDAPAVDPHGREIPE
jgi:manganese/zinc/iron transport system permease protein